MQLQFSLEKAAADCQSKLALGIELKRAYLTKLFEVVTLNLLFGYQNKKNVLE